MPNIFENIGRGLTYTFDPQGYRADRALDLREKQMKMMEPYYQGRADYYSNPQRHQRDLRATFGDKQRFVAELNEQIQSWQWEPEPTDPKEKNRRKMLIKQRDTLIDSMIEELGRGQGKVLQGGANPVKQDWLQGAPPAAGGFRQSGKSVKDMTDEELQAIINAGR